MTVILLKNKLGSRNIAIKYQTIEDEVLNGSSHTTFNLFNYSNLKSSRK